jgi:NAD(P)-dependent dehydrogenase (short-subunit alcohol dehydrogenase family)
MHHVSSQGGEQHRVALVTGAAQGIGEATARELSSRGYVVAVTDIDLESATGTASLLDDALAVEMDVTDHRSVEEGVRRVLDWRGTVDLLVNNAGLIPGGTLAETPPEVWERAFAVNVRGVYNCCHVLLPHMLERQSGVIVSVASAAGLVGIPNRAAYCATKGAIVTLTKALAIDHVRDGIRVNCVCPGTADTPHVQAVIARSEDPERTRANLIERQPIGRLAEPAEIAKAIAYLASDDAAYITGTALVIDGGLLAG